MDNYTVVTNDGDEVGHVVGQADGSIIVESGLLRKTRHAIPQSFVHVDDPEQTVRVTISKNVIEDSPKIENGDPDLAEVARYYGLAGGFDPAGLSAGNPD